MTPERYKARLQVMHALIPSLLLLPLEDMLAAAQRASNVGAILDPTLYRSKAKALEEDIEMISAFRSLQQLLQHRMPEAAAVYSELRLADNDQAPS